MLSQVLMIIGRPTARQIIEQIVTNGDTLKERLAGPKPLDPIKDDIMKNRQRIKYYQLNTITEDK